MTAGGSTLLESTSACQLAGWLGQGDLTLTRVFSHASGDGKTSADFHAAADGKGATFSVLQVTAVDGIATNLLVGGYDPTSWSSSDLFHTAGTDADRTAFLFNLTDGTLLREKLGTDPVTGNSGAQQTLNYLGAGPTFGAGTDLTVDGSLNGGRSEFFSYGPAGARGGSGIIGTPASRPVSLTYGALEVFTITPGGAVSNPPAPGTSGDEPGPAAPPATPLPPSALGGAALLALVGASRVRRQRGHASA